MLAYATGGVAMTMLKYQHDFRGTGDTLPGGLSSTPGIVVEPDIFEHASASRTVAGWTVGGGAELPVLSNVSLRAKYLFTEFAKISTTKIFPLNGARAPDYPCGFDTGQGGFGSEQPQLQSSASAINPISICTAYGWP